MSESADDSKSQDTIAGVRVVTLHLPEDEGEGLGFKLTRTIWDPYPWVREVTAGQRADAAGLRSGDCLLQADGRDLLGLPVGQVAGVIRGDGGGHGVSLLVWSCGASPQDDPELLWSAGGGARGERSRRALSGVLRALACCVCSATAASPRARAAQCARGHIYCAGCRARLQRCALCRETLPPVDSPHARSLVAEQVFEAIASVYELKDSTRTPNTSASSTGSPACSPTPSPRTTQASVSQRNSPSCLRKTVQFGLSTQPHHGSDNTLNRPKPNMPEFSLKRLVLGHKQSQGSQTDLRDLTGSPIVEKSGLVWKENAQKCQKSFNNPGSQKSCHNWCECACQSFEGCRSCGQSDEQTTRCCKSTSDFECCQNSSVKRYSKRQVSSENVSKSSHSASENVFKFCRNSSERCCHSSSERKCCQHLSERCCQRSSEICCQGSSEMNICQEAPERKCCENSSERCCQSPPERCCQRSSERCCQRSSERKRQNSSDRHYCHETSNCCPVNTQKYDGGELMPQLLQRGLNLVPLSAVSGLQHRLVARLRPASSLADLRTGSHNTEGLSKSWNNIHSGDSASGEKSGSMNDLPSPDLSAAAGDEVFVISAQAPVLVWAYQQ